MAYPSNQYYIPVTVTGSKWSESSEQWIYQIDMSSVMISDSIFKILLTVATKLAIYDYTGTKIPRFVEWDGNNVLLISFNGPKDAANNRIFRVYVDSGINEANSTTTWSLSNSAHRYGCNEFTTSTTLHDSLGTIDGGKSGVVNVGLNSGKFGNALYFPSNTGFIKILSNTDQSNVGKLSNEIMINLNSLTTATLFSKYKDSTHQYTLTNTGTTIRIILCNGNSSYGELAISGNITTGIWYHISVVFNGTDYATNDTRLKLYINGIQKTLTFSGTIPDTTYNFGASDWLIYGAYGTSSPALSYFDEIVQYTDEKSANYALDRYIQFFDPAVFSYGTGVSPAVITNMVNLSENSFNIIGTGLGGMTPTVTISGIPCNVHSNSGTVCQVTATKSIPSGYVLVSFTTSEEQVTTYSFNSNEANSSVSLKGNLSLSL